jgi:hypothetical protein
VEELKDISLSCLIELVKWCSFGMAKSSVGSLDKAAKISGWNLGFGNIQG